MVRTAHVGAWKKVWPQDLRQTWRVYVQGCPCSKLDMFLPLVSVLAAGRPPINKMAACMLPQSPGTCRTISQLAFPGAEGISTFETTGR